MGDIDQLLQIEQTAVAGHKIVCVRLWGQIDLSSEGQLASLAKDVAGYQIVCLEMAGVTFAGTTLLHFLVAVRDAMPVGGCLIVCRPRSLVMRVLNLSGLDLIVSVQANLPPVWITPGVVQKRQSVEASS